MKKIMLALDPENWNRNAVDIACFLAKISRSMVNGVFLGHNDDLEQEHRPDEQSKVNTANTIFNKSGFVNRLKDACISRETGYSIHNDHLSSVSELISETTFSDILIIDPAITLNPGIEAPPSSLTKHILHHAHCPVILAQGSFKDMAEIIFTYDGSIEASRAIKQFSYLFPEFINRRITVLEIDKNGTDHIAEKIKLMEWMNMHYHYVAYVTLEGNVAGSLSGYLLAHPKSFVVMGAYGRSFISRLLKPSTANPVAGMVNNPIFVTHR